MGSLNRDIQSSPCREPRRLHACNFVCERNSIVRITTTRVGTRESRAGRMSPVGFTGTGLEKIMVTTSNAGKYPNEFH
jgi:hypothetical protein